MAIRRRVLLSMLPPLEAVRFGPSQQLIWVIRFSAHRLWGGRERADGKAVRGRGEREEQKDIHGDNDERTGAALLGFTLYL
jgi:hypothetical protein